MTIPLETIDIWEYAESFSIISFLEALKTISDDQSILVVGSYEPLPHIHIGLVHRTVTVEGQLPRLPFDEFYEINRDQYPDGKYSALQFTHGNLDELITLAEQSGECLSFDNVVAYRPGEPILPLVNFHDAFIGGVLWLSGHYSAEKMSEFSKQLGVTGQRVMNPVLNYLQEPSS